MSEQNKEVGVTSYMPGTDGFTMACFHAKDVPVGTKLYVASKSPAPIPEQVAPSYWNSQRKMIERAIVGLRDGWATREDADAALAVLASSYAPTKEPVQEVTQQAAPTAWLATDLDGRGDVAFTKEEAKRRAGEGCTEFFPLYDRAPTTSTVSATAEESRKDADWARAVAFASANQNVSTASASDQWKSLVDKAVDVLQRHIVPDGLSDSDAINLMYSIFDGAEYRAAQAATDKSED